MASIDFIAQVAADLKIGKKRRCTVKAFLREYRYKRRGADVVSDLRRRLRKYGIITSPDFATADYEGMINFGFKQQPDLPLNVKEPQPAPEPPAASQAVQLKPLNPYGMVPTPESGYRLIFRDFLTYFQALNELGKTFSISAKGQNRLREDRDAFPFYIAIPRKQLAGTLNLKDHYEILKLVEGYSKVQPVELLSEGETETIAVGEPTVVDVEGLESRITSQLASSLSDIRSTLEDSLLSLKSEMQAQVEELRHDSIRKLAAIHSDGELQKLVDDEHDRYQAELGQRDELLELSEGENRELRARLEELERDLNDQIAQYDPADAFSTMEGTVLLFREMCKGNPVEVLPSAIRSAGQCASKRRLEVLQLLIYLRETAIFLYTIRGTMAPFPSKFSRSGYDYAAQDSEPTTNKFGDKRRFLVDGEKVLFEEHVTLYPNSPDCVQVYFRRDNEKSVLQVGYCGVHLPTVSR